MSGEEKPTFTEDTVADDFVDAIDREIVDNIGFSTSSLARYGWASDEDNDGGWPFVVERDGRKFEVDIDVHVTELTPERLAQRAAEEQRVLTMLQWLESQS